ncbi:UPF0502 protein [Shewanella sp. NFH-SH190041]|uniref:YceH family protein n=1 Tax=Shewanella sp. NFH-SH190041 TaxID=2950245 RepID=UPI0021C49075|nr:DUF480 domain-containing protein [Shewanella sp. NFH-SH190041]BDM64529.1 UPF0502 protein [Shewanella sp. NFH-SH190041]
MQLTSIEARVIGCLMEKEVTTPEQYPLSLNALTQACNQKTSREPVMSLSDIEVQQALDELNKKRLISEQSGFGSRVVKYKHRFCNTEFSDLQLSKSQFAVICLLLLRGAQTPGELRTRAGRLYDFSSITEVENVLSELSNRDEPIIRQLPREVGKRESRYCQLFCAAPEAVTSSASSVLELTPRSDDTTMCDRISQLEQDVAELKAQLAELKQLLE